MIRDSEAKEGNENFARQDNSDPLSFAGRSLKGCEDSFEIFW
jgi:hypothetical protein